MAGRWWLILLLMMATVMALSPDARGRPGNVEDEDVADEEAEDEEDWEDEDDLEEDDENEDEEEDVNGEAEEEAVRALSELPMSQLLALRKTINFGNTSSITPVGSATERVVAAAGAGVRAAAGAKAVAGATGPEALALSGPPRRGGPPPWADDEMVVEVEEEEESWMPAPMMKSKSETISKIFQGSVTALAFLAFGGYLLCLIVQAIKNKEHAMMAMVPGAAAVTPEVPAPQQLRPVLIASGRRRRRRRRSRRATAHAYLPPDPLLHSFFMLAEGYARYSGAPMGP